MSLIGIMKLTAHFIASSILALALYYFFGVNSLFVFVSGFLIDIDHYPIYVMRFKSLNPFKANSYFIEEMPMNVLCVFHAFEFLIALVIITFFSPIGSIMIVGWVVHMAMDYYGEYRKGIRGGAKVKFITAYLFRHLK